MWQTSLAGCGGCINKVLYSDWNAVENANSFAIAVPDVGFGRIGERAVP
jgi:hypothetical protein